MGRGGKLRTTGIDELMDENVLPHISEEN